MISRVLLSALLVGVLGMFGTARAADFIVVASTTSTENSGLFAHLLPTFEAEHGFQVRVVAVGTGAALQYGRRCDADVVMVHAPALEAEFVAAAYGVERHSLMHNDFVIVGPAADPAAISGLDSAVAALARIAQHQARFVSRSDRSGTHAKEMELWNAVPLRPNAAPARWYLETGAGMGQSLNTARAMDAYILSDRGTWLGFGNRGDLRVLLEGDPLLHNPYGVILVNPERCRQVKAELGQRFIDWLLSERGQDLIAQFEIEGKPLFTPARPAGPESRVPRPE